MALREAHFPASALNALECPGTPGGAYATCCGKPGDQQIQGVGMSSFPLFPIWLTTGGSCSFYMLKISCSALQGLDSVFRGGPFSGVVVRP